MLVRRMVKVHRKDAEKGKEEKEQCIRTEKERGFGCED
jgi:hypothetical protein